MVCVRGVSNGRFVDGGHVTTGAFFNVSVMRLRRELLVARHADSPNLRRPRGRRTMWIVTGTAPELSVGSLGATTLRELLDFAGQWDLVPGISLQQVSGEDVFGRLANVEVRPVLTRI
jgi:hypothetical protein